MCVRGGRGYPDEAQQAEAAQMLLFILEFDARQSTSSEQQHITNDHPDAAAAADDDDDDNANMGQSQSFNYVSNIQYNTKNYQNLVIFLQATIDMIRFALENWQASCQFNLAHKLKLF